MTIVSTQGKRRIRPQTRTTPRKKVMLCVWWDMKGVVYHEVLNQNETVNAEKYCRKLEALHKHLQKKRPSLVNRRVVLLLRDNARPRIARVTQEKIMALNMEVLPLFS